MKFFTLEEILEEKMKTPGFAERFERAGQELAAEFAAERAKYGTFANPKRAMRRGSLPLRKLKVNRAGNGFAAHLKRVRAVAQ